MVGHQATVNEVYFGLDDEVALSVGVQKMVRSDRSVSGVAFSLDTESGFKDIVMIEASYGLGEAIVQGLVLPDEYMVFKTTFNNDFYPLIKKRLGSKKEKIIYGQISSYLGLDSKRNS